MHMLQNGGNMPDQKLDNLLNLALDATEEEREKSRNLNVGYEKQTRKWEIIVKYSEMGDSVEALLGGPEISVVPLLGRYAIVTLPESMLEEYLVQGGNLFFLPGQSSVSPQNHFLQKLQAPHWGSRDTSTLVYHIETQSSLFRNVFEQEDKHAVLPQITYFYPLIPVSGTENLLTDKRGNILLAGKTFGKGTLYLSAFSFTPANSNMVFHPLFVPLMANMACRLNAASNTSYFLNTTQAIPLTPQKYRENSPLHIRKEDRSFEFIPEIRKDFSGDLLLTNNYNIREAGLYEIVQEEQVIGVLAWNYDRTESQMEFCPEETLQQQFLHARVENIKTTRTDYNSQLVKEIILADTNKYLTSWFLMLAIIALLLEQIIWRRKLN